MVTGWTRSRSAASATSRMDETRAEARVAVGVVGINFVPPLSRFSAGCSGLLDIVAGYLEVVFSTYRIAICPCIISKSL